MRHAVALQGVCKISINKVYICNLNVIDALRLSSQIGLEIGMSDFDQRCRALFERLASQLGDTVFGHHVINKSPLGRHHTARFKRGNDARNMPPFHHGTRRCHDNRSAGITVGGRNRKDGLAAGTGVHKRAERFGAGLPAEINRQRVIDSNIIFLVDQDA